MSSKYLNIKSEKQLVEVTKLLIPQIKNGGILAFTGELGAGKTALAKKLIRELGCEQTVTSPTFTIINTFQTNDGRYIFHLDLYRLKKIDELENIGFSEIIEDPQNIVIIEWPELAKTELPDRTIWVNIEIVNEIERKITIN